MDIEKRKQTNKKVLLVIGVGFGVLIAGWFLMVLFVEKPKREAEQAKYAVQHTKDSIESARIAELGKQVKAEHGRRMKVDREYRDSVNAANAAATKAIEDRERMENPSSFVKIDTDWHMGGFGRVPLANVKITNKSLRTLRNARITFEFLSESGKSYGTKTVEVAKVWKPGETKSSGELNLGFANEQTTRLGSKFDGGDWE